MNRLIPLIALSLLALTACEKETKQVKDEPVADAATDAAPKPAADKPAACEPVALTKIELPCISLTHSKNPETMAILRTQAELDARYAARDVSNLSDECKNATAPTIDFTKHSVLLVGVTSGGCSVNAETAACLGPHALEVKTTVHSHGLCEKMAYIHDAYTLPVVPADVSLRPTFTHEQHKD